jgi:UDP-N-acetylglucosamine enolpyruvyl transferase
VRKERKRKKRWRKKKKKRVDEPPYPGFATDLKLPVVAGVISVYIHGA